MKLRNAFLTGLLCLFYTGLWAQPALEDAQGNSTMFLNFNPAFSLNTGSGEIDFQYARFKPDASLFWGIKVGGIPDAKLLNYLRTGGFKKGVNAKGFVGIMELFTAKGDNLDWITLSASGAREKYALFDSDRSWDQQLYDTLGTDYGLQLSYQYLLKGKTVFGISAGLARSNNYANLPTGTISTPIILVDTNTGQVRNIATDEQKAALGDFSSMTEFSFGVEALHFFTSAKSEKVIALHGYVRNDISTGSYNLRPGLNVYLLKNQENASLTDLPVLFGVNIEYNDALNNTTGDASPWGHLKSSVTLGFSLK